MSESTPAQADEGQTWISDELAEALEQPGVREAIELYEVAARYYVAAVQAESDHVLRFSAGSTA